MVIKQVIRFVLKKVNKITIKQVILKVRLRFKGTLNCNFEGIQHTHNIFLELAFNHGLLVAFLIFFLMTSILISASTKNLFKNENQGLSFIDKAWIIKFMIFIIKMGYIFYFTVLFIYLFLFKFYIFI